MIAPNHQFASSREDSIAEKSLDCSPSTNAGQGRSLMGKIEWESDESFEDSPFNGNFDASKDEELFEYMNLVSTDDDSMTCPKVREISEEEIEAVRRNLFEMYFKYEEL